MRILRRRTCVILAVVVAVMVLVVVGRWVGFGGDRPLGLPIYMISLEHRETARAKRQEIAHRIREPVITVYGVDGHALPVEAGCNHLQPGERGCFLSHLNVLNMIYDAGHEMALVIEDDTTLELPRAAALIRVYMNLLPSDWEILQLGQAGWSHSRQVPISPFFSRIFMMGNSHSYIIHRRGVRRLRQLLARDPHPECGDTPFDLWLGNKLIAYQILPSLLSVPTRPVDVNISDTRGGPTA